MGRLFFGRTLILVMTGISMADSSKIALATFASWTGLAAGAVGQVQESATFELSSFQEGETWEYVLGEEVLRAERRDGVVEIGQVRRGGEPPRPLLGCAIAEDRCSIRIEQSEGQTGVRLIRERNDAREELVLKDRGGWLTLVAGMVATSRVGDRFRSRLLAEPATAGTSNGGQATDSTEVFLRCPEGDSWMQLPLEEAEGSYYSCQRHGHQLEIAGGAGREPMLGSWNSNFRPTLGGSEGEFPIVGEHRFSGGKAA